MILDQIYIFAALNNRKMEKYNELKELLASIEADADKFLIKEVKLPELVFVLVCKR